MDNRTLFNCLVFTYGQAEPKPQLHLANAELALVSIDPVPHPPANREGIFFIR